MISHLLQILGLSDHVVEAEQLSWHWHRPAWLIVGLVLLAPLAWFIARIHRENFAHLSTASRRMLTACRVGILALLVLILGGPFVRINETKSGRPVLIMLLDESASMSLPADVSRKHDGPHDPANAGVTRMQQVAAALEKYRDSVFVPLSQRFDLRTYRFSRMSRPVDGLSTVGSADVNSQDDTAIGDAMERAQVDSGRLPIAGMVLLTDGRSTVGRDPLDVINSRSSTGPVAPIFSVPVGPSDVLADVALIDVLCTGAVARGDVAVVHASLRATKLSGRIVHVRLLDGDRELDSVAVTVRDDQPQRVALQFRDTNIAGHRKIRIAADIQKEESYWANNTKDLRIDINDHRISVLYMESAPRWDYRFLDHALRRDKSMDVTVIMESQLLASGVKIEDLPAAAKMPTDASQFAKYSVIMLGDVSPDLLTPAIQEQLALAVKERGVGLMVQAGTQSMPHRFTAGPLSALLPVKVREVTFEQSEGTDEARIIGGIEAPSYAPFQMNLTAIGAIHPSFAMDSLPGRGRSVWNQMPPFYWAAQTTEAHPGATVLADIALGGRTIPLIAEHRSGRGRVLFVGTDSTYLWRRNMGDVYFQRFWGQAIRHVAGPTAKQGQRARLEVNPQVVRPGDAVNIELHTLAADGKAVDHDINTVTVYDAQRAASLPPIVLHSEQAVGVYRGTWTAEQHGEYAFGHTSEDTSLTAVVYVDSAGDEVREPTADRQMLGALAQRSGGKLLELDELAKLTELLPGLPSTEMRLHEEDLWDNWLVLLALSTMYCVDVAIRRLNGVA